MAYNLIGRLHIGGKNLNNSWKKLSQYLDIEITPIEPTKASVMPESTIQLDVLKFKIKEYNKKHDTDFFIE